MTFQRSEFANEGDEAGVFIDGLARALLTWCAMQDVTPTVADAMQAFNTTEEVIVEAVGLAHWIYIEGTDDDPNKRRLELDGE